MPLVSASADAFVATTVAVAAPLAYFLRPKQSSNAAPARDWLSLLVLLHSVYILYVLTLQWPPNIFQRLRIPLTTPSDTIRAILLERAGLDADATLPKPLETLLTRLSLFDVRALYVRFGQTVLQDCEYCKTFDEYAMYALPGPLLQYMREAAVVGLLTVRSSYRGRWRTYAVSVLVCAAVMEGYWISSGPVKIPRNGLNVFMWHDNLWFLRQLLFLVLPILVHVLPGTLPPPDPHSVVANTYHALDQTKGRLLSLKYVRGAVMRDNSLRTAATEWWGKQRMVGTWAREDEGVQRAADKLGWAYEKANEDDPVPPYRAQVQHSVEAVRAKLVSGS